MSVCPVCGTEFTPHPFGGNVVYCSPACGKTAHRRGETAAILKSETKPIRTAPMTDEEFDALYHRLRRQLQQEGKPLYRTDMGGYAEKQKRIDADNAAQTHQNRSGRAEGAYAGRAEKNQDNRLERTTARHSGGA